MHIRGTQELYEQIPLKKSCAKAPSLSVEISEQQLPLQPSGWAQSTPGLLTRAGHLTISKYYYGPTLTCAITWQPLF